MTEIPTNEIIEFGLNSDNIKLDDATIDSIMVMVFEEVKKIDTPFTTIGIATLKTEIDWQWKTDRGTLPKRIDNWFYKKTNTSLDAQIVSQIGNLARAKVPKDQKYWFDINTTFDWRQGDFGDHGSCFFSSNPTVMGSLKLPGWQLDVMRNDDRFQAIRFFKPIEKKNTTLSWDDNHFYEDEDKFYIGLSRAWIWNSFIKGKKPWGVPEETYSTKTFFNGYGLTTESISHVFSAYVEKAYKYVSIKETDLYINNNGYIVGDPKVIESVSEVPIHEKEYEPTFSLFSEQLRPPNDQQMIDDAIDQINYRRRVELMYALGHEAYAVAA